MSKAIYIPLFIAASSFFAVAEAGNSPKVDSLLAALHNSKADTSAAKILVKLGDELYRANDKKTIFYLDSAVKLSQKINYKKGSANAYMTLGNYYSLNNNYKLALEYDLKSLSLMQELGNINAQTKIYRSIGTTYYGIHDLDNALKNYEAGLSIAQRSGLKNDLAGLLSNIGIIWHSKKDYGKAMENYILALKAAEASKDKRSRSYVLNSMGKLYFDLGIKDENAHDFDQAVNYYTQSFDLKMEMGDKKGMANSYGNISQVEEERGNSQKALDDMLKGYMLAKETDYKEWLEMGCVNLSDLYAKSGDYKNSLAYYKEHISIRDTLASINNLKAMADLQDKFDDAQKDKEIALYKKDKDLQESIVTSQRLKLWFASAGLVIVIIFAFYIFRGYKEKQKINLVIEEKNKNITDSIMYARRIQTAILPSKEIMLRSLPHHFIFYKPKDIVSGDFYFFAETKNKLIVAAADCTGHGVPGAFMSMIGNSLLNQIIKEKGINQPAEILTYLHTGVSNALNQNKESENGEAVSSISMKDGMDIVLCSIDKSTKKIEYAGANRNLYFIGNEGLKEVIADKSAIGGEQSETEKKFTNHIIDFSVGDTIYLSTDGYADQFGGPEGKKFRTKNFKTLLVSLKEKEIDEQKNILDSTISNWMGSIEQLDDILVIGIKL